MKTVTKIAFAVIVICIILLALSHPMVSADAQVSPIKSVAIADTILAVVMAENYKAPAQDDTLGLFGGFASLGFIAHDNLAGDHIKKMFVGQVITITYADGATAKYRVYIIGSAPATATMGQIYSDTNALVFQTCIDKNTRFIVKARPLVLMRRIHRLLGV